MLRIYNSIASASDIKGYFKQSLAREDYYSKEMEVRGLWGGKLRSRLGLEGEIEQKDFYSLIDNLHPETNEQLSPRMAANRRIGMDISFSAPKSVSLAYAVSRDEKILDAFNQAARDTMTELEEEAKVRVRKGGLNENRTTGEMIWGHFTHFTSRPEKDQEGIQRIDPQIHCHMYCFNLSYDNKEERFKALENSGIKMNAPYFEAAFHSRLAMNLKEAGYSIERNGRYMELAGVNRELIEKFSNRTSKIERLAAKRNLSASEKDKLGASSRRGKESDLPFDKLQEGWLKRLDAKELMSLSKLKSASSDFAPKDARGALEHALSDELERKSVVKEKRIMMNALHQSYGKATPDDIKKQVKANRQMIRTLIEGEAHATTKDAINGEIQMITYAREGKGKADPLITSPHVFKRDFLNEEQKLAVNHILNSTDEIVLVSGGAGTGKTTLISEVNEALSKSDKELYAFAPSAAASRGVLKDEGFKNADTLASLLNSKELQAKMKNQVIWVDEAGQVGVPSMNRLFQIAKKQNARVLLTGDTLQHGAIEKGDSLRLLQERAGLKVASVREIQRQKKASYKEIVDLIQKGKIEKALKQIDKNGSLIEISDKEKKYDRIAEDYLTILGKKESALVVAPTKKEGKEVTKAIREKLSQNGLLETDQKEFLTQKNLHYTEAQRSDSNNYQKGMSVQFIQNSKGFMAGNKYDVVSSKKGVVMVQGKDGEVKSLSLDKSKLFQVFEKDRIQLAVGEKIRITQNGSSQNKKRLHNGNEFEVKGFTKEGDILLSKNVVLSKDHRNYDYSYTSTSYNSQGKTINHVLISQNTESAKASSKEQFYVSMSRGRKSATIYTDDKEKLKDAVQKSSERVSALELKEKGSPIKTKAREMMENSKEKMQEMLKQARELALRQAQILAHKRNAAARGR